MSTKEIKDRKDIVQDETKPTWSRRNFLKASLASTGVLALSPLGRKEAQAQNGNGTVQEEWFEPWEWRVSEYGSDDYLQLNVVEHQAPAIVTGGPALPLFSYNGMAPGPTIRVGGDAVLRLQIVNQLSGNNGKYAFNSNSRYVKTNKNVPNIPDWQLANMVYGPHQQHTTNIHTHGLHVSPRPNPDGTNSDNVYLRIIPEQDYQNRERNKTINWPLKNEGQHREVKKEARYEIRLGKSSGSGIETHPPGTHWYHPHPHGATYDQVATGMAGFLIVEGDVDESLKNQIKGYRERLMLFQRVVSPPPAESEEPKRVAGQQAKTAFPGVNGRAAGKLVMVMQPGAIERWRFLNGSVDGQGYIEFMVVKGTPPTVRPKPQLPKNPTPAQKTRYQGEMRAFNAQLAEQNQYLDSNKVTIDHLAFDGITLVNRAGNYDTALTSSLILAPANRADFLFQAPPLASGETSATYTLWGKWVADATDTAAVHTNVQIATVSVQGATFNPGVTRNPQGKLNLNFPPVPNLIKPIPDSEITIQTGANQGKWRTRQLVYAGWGDASYPCDGKEYPHGPQTNFDFNSMTIDSQKFDPDQVRHKMGLGTAEEWTLTNSSLTIFTSDGTVYYGAEAAKRARQNKILLATSPTNVTLNSKAADHPFHIHQNPCWVLSIKDADGKELLPNGQPRWQDVIRIPRNGGQVIFRSRFWDYVGDFVNHCHLLQHEDWGMMQQIGVVANKQEADFVPQPAGYRYPKPSLKEMYQQCLVFWTPVHWAAPPRTPGGMRPMPLQPEQTQIQYCPNPSPPPPA